MHLIKKVLPMADTSSVKSNLLTSFRASDRRQVPYTHWLVHGLLPEQALDEICALPLAAPEIGDTQGRRETHNSSRFYFNPEQQARFPICAAVAQAFQSDDLIAQLKALTGARLNGSFLRIENCMDIDGFWLEPHTDIGAKLFTLLLYLNDAPAGENWGTDIYMNRQRIASVPQFRDTIPGSYSSLPATPSTALKNAESPACGAR